MAQPMQPQRVGPVGLNGVIREAEVDSTLIPEGAVTDVQNFHFDRKGAATVRPGLTTLGATANTTSGATAVGLFNAQASTALVAFSIGNSVIVQRYNGASWATLTNNMTASASVRFVDFAKNTIILNGMYDSIRVWDGSTGAVTTSGAPINPDQFTHDTYINTQTLRAKFGEVYKSRVYLAGDPTTPSRLFFSSVISSTGNITFTPANDWVDINPGDGEGITAIKRYSLELEVFKPNYIYRFRTSGVDPDPIIKIGTRSQESVVEGKRGLYFHHDSGFYRYSGGYPDELSRPISDIVDAIPYSQYASIDAWNDQDHIYWSIGNVTVQETLGPVTWKNCVVRYTESSDVWTIYSYAQDIRRGSVFNNGTTLTRMVATDKGVVATHNSGTTDLGEPIKYRLKTKWYEWENIATQKIIEELVTICEKAQGMEVMCFVDEEYQPQAIGQMTKMVQLHKNKKIVFHRIRFQVSGISRYEASVFRALEITKGLNEGILVNV